MPSTTQWTEWRGRWWFLHQGYWFEWGKWETTWARWRTSAEQQDFAMEEVGIGPEPSDERHLALAQESAESSVDADLPDLEPLFKRARLQ